MQASVQHRFIIDGVLTVRLCVICDLSFFGVNHRCNMPTDGGDIRLQREPGHNLFQGVVFPANGFKLRGHVNAISALLILALKREELQRCGPGRHDHPTVRP